MKQSSKSQKLHFFLWNDEESYAKSWRETIMSDGFPKVEICFNLNVDSVLKEYESDFYDIVICDVICGDNRPLGLDIVQAIRNSDPIVPIITITRYPKTVYEARELESYTLTGIFHADVMQPMMFRDVVLRPSLNQWHMSVFEFSLVRRCLWQLKETFGDWDDDNAVNLLRNCLQRLPFSPSIKSWHKQLCSTIIEILERRGFEDMRTIYSDIVNIFQDADSFHTANKSGKRHLAHNVQVFLMGLIILLEEGNLKGLAVESSKKVFNTTEPLKSLLDAILIWGCISTTHDVAYLSQDMKQVIDTIVEISNKFKPALAKLMGQEPKDLKKGNWPTNSHGEVGAMLWESKIDILAEEKKKKSKNPVNDREKEAVSIISKAIESHDRSNSPPIKLAAENWAQFLLILCDELQDWHRDRKEKEPGEDPIENIPWRIFALETFRINKEDDYGKIKLEMQFVAKDYPNFVLENVGKPGRKIVQQNFSKILDTLSNRLCSEKEWEIELSAEFISRDITPAVRRRKLSTG
ncbi:hypothetical protein ACFLRT_00395 [Acidobacteriota bacterium]